MVARLVLHALLLVKQVLTCDYAPPPKEEVSYGNAEYPEDHRAKRNIRIWDWIRIETEYDATFNLLAEDKKELLEDLITTARDYFETTLKVQRLQSIQLMPHCLQSMGGIYPNGDVLCDVDCERRCGGALAPESAVYFSKCLCKNTRCPTRGKWGGVLKNADFVLFVSVKEDGCGPGTLAYAAHCSLDKRTNRPIAGYINVCATAFIRMKSNEMAQWQATLKHELIHAFVFSSSLYPKFVGASRIYLPEGQNQSSVDEKIIPGVVERFVRQDWEAASGFIPHEVYMIVTPRVREEARKHFSCPSLEGAELENQGGVGSVGSHWEKRVFENEAMSAVATQVYALSRLTLALLEDSGWYEVNYDKAESMLWGRGLGCNFAKRSCLTWMKSNSANPYPFCTLYDDARCSANRMAKVRCNLQLAQYDALPSEYNYNIRNLYHDGKGKEMFGIGSVEQADFCPYYRVYGELSREDSDTRCTYSGNSNYNNYSLEVFSPTARCFQILDGILVKSTHAIITYAHKVGCYENVCKDNRLLIKTQNSKFYPCYHGGQFIHVEKRVPEIGIVQFRIVCPSCSEICGQQFCAPDDFGGRKIGDPTRSEAIRDGAAVPLFVLLVMYRFQ